LDKEYVQHLRYKLQKRVRRLNSVQHPQFHYALVHVWQWITSQPVFAGILEDLAKAYPSAAAEAMQIKNGESLVGSTEFEHVALAHAVLKLCVADPTAIEQNIEFVITRKFEKRLDGIKEQFVEPLYEYLDEQLDDQRAILALLRKYKQKCEWFQRESLFKMWSDDTARGEKRLAMHLYEYLHDQGLEFSIEPASASGEADLVAAQASDDPLILDAKIFDPEKSKGKSSLVKAFRQIYSYTVDFTQPFGYLLIFKTCEADLKLALTNSEQFTPSVTYNNKTIFFLVIDIFCYDEPASKRPPLKAVEITEADLVDVLSTDAPY
jgi:hypothetical protein